VAHAEGVALTQADADDVIAWIEALPPDAGSSILTDRRAGRALEWEARNAVIGRLGRRHGIPTPVSDTVAAAGARRERRRHIGRSTLPPTGVRTYVRALGQPHDRSR
jgi:ketopantoate reductase